MSDTTTSSTSTSLLSSYITVAIASTAVLVSTAISVLIIAFTILTPNLRTPTNILIANTCCCTLIYSGISIMNTFFFYFDRNGSDWSCRFRGYLGYVSLNLVLLSYVMQSISRLFWTVFYKYRVLLTDRCHRYLIVIQYLMSFLLPISTLMTNHITNRPLRMCFVPIRFPVHAYALLISGYVIPVLAMICIYMIIYFTVRRSTSNIQRGSRRSMKRDVSLARNILILFSIFIFGGIPTLFYFVTSERATSVSRVLVLLAVAAPHIAVAMEKVLTWILNKDLQKAFKERWNRNSSIAPVQAFSTSRTVDTQRR